MLQSGIVLQNQFNREQIVFLKTGHETAGEYFCFEALFEREGGVKFLHNHPYQEEHIEIVHGQARLYRNGEYLNLVEGDSITIAPGTMHFFNNIGDDVLHVRTELRPALRSDEMMELVPRRIAENNLDQRPLARLLQLAVIQQNFEAEMRLPFLMQLGVWLVASIGRLLGYRGA